MPNWCNNSIVINGDKDKIKQIRDVLETMDKTTTETGIFEALVGRDENITEEQYQNGGWYNHNINRFGCKWDVSYENAVIDGDDEYITMNPDTAWSPPEGFCRLLALKYGVSVNLEYSEPGNYFAGRFNIDENGEEISESYDYLEGLYHIDEEYFWMEVRNDLEYLFDDEDEPKSVEEWLQDFSFVRAGHKSELIDLYNEVKEQQEQTN
jgi:hypothetical protein